MERYVVSIISVLLGYFSSLFANRKPRGFLEKIGILFILGSLAVGLTLLGDRISKPRPTPPPPPDKLAGQWIEEYVEGGETRYAIATFGYDSNAGYLAFEGDAYDKNLTHIGHWKTKHAVHDRGQYDYMFHGASGDPKNPGTRNGVGGIHFQPNGKEGTGYFLSVRDDPMPRRIDLYKILDDEAAKESISNPKTFIEKLYAKKGDYIKQINTAR